jgi:hypothetical protein
MFLEHIDDGGDTGFLAGTAGSTPRRVSDSPCPDSNSMADHEKGDKQRFDEHARFTWTRHPVPTIAHQDASARRNAGNNVHCQAGPGRDLRRTDTGNPGEDIT